MASYNYLPDIERLWIVVAVPLQQFFSVFSLFYFNIIVPVIDSLELIAASALFLLFV